MEENCLILQTILLLLFCFLNQALWHERRFWIKKKPNFAYWAVEWNAIGLTTRGLLKALTGTIKKVRVCGGCLSMFWCF